MFCSGGYASRSDADVVVWNVMPSRLPRWVSGTFYKCKTTQQDVIFTVTKTAMIESEDRRWIFRFNAKNCSDLRYMVVRDEA